MIILFKRILIESKIEPKLTLNNSVIFVGAALLSAFVFSAIAASFQFLLLPDISFIQMIIKYFLGYGSGGAVIGSSVVFSAYYQKEDAETQGGLVLSILSITVFVGFSIFMFMNNGREFINGTYLFIYLGLFFIPVFFFSFKMLMTITIIYIPIAHSLYLSSLSGSLLSRETRHVHVFLMTMVATATITRLILLETRRKNSQLEKAHNQLEDLLESTFDLLRLGEVQEFQEEFNSIEYLRDLFKVGANIFNNYDRASCYVRGEEFVNFIAGVGYDIDYLNESKFRIEDFEWKKSTPNHIIDSSTIVKKSLKTNYKDYIKRNPELRESITFCLFLEESLVGGISFDITVDSDKKFTKVDYDNIKAYQNLMNSFYQTRFLMSKNNSLKDEIVLSLIRTLELYDQYTGGHSEEVALLSQMIALSMGLSKEAV
jgi:HD-GYP domain-containing protein (c-di-GMP phosphodiesterase class II)